MTTTSEKKLPNRASPAAFGLYRILNGVQVGVMSREEIRRLLASEDERLNARHPFDVLFHIPVSARLMWDELSLETKLVMLLMAKLKTCDGIDV